MDDDGLDLFGAFDEKETIRADEVVPTPAPKRRKVNEAKPPTCPDRKNGHQEEAMEQEEAPSTSITVSAPKVRLQTGTAAGEESTEPKVSTGTTEKNIIDFVAMPEDYKPETDSQAIESRKPAKEYPFKLDPFQATAVNYIERNESVLVAAHTSAGKTAVAEYAIAKSLRDKQRVVYTSPIKALSNQKYRDLQEEFEDVGLMTGDITINPNATCLIMTTEILRSMLYRGSELMREVAWVIYDEIHYMRDKERGVVWEESIVLLPNKVRFVFLSATIPNSKEFASWIASIKRQPCHVVYTDYRPTPLQHYIFASGGDGLHLVVDEKGKFREENFQKAIAALASSAEDEALDGSKKGRRKNKKQGGSDLVRIVKMILDRNYDPVIVFSFSKRDCEAYALQMSKLDFNDEQAKEFVEKVFTNAIDSLSDDDKKLPQVDHILPLLKRGIGIHHGGLLPILKEVVEILFGEGLLKCLFATETFAMGVNMPAKTVVFTQCRKFDGKDFRWINAGEYIQMSGRAGRRGLDSRGIVIQMLDEKMEPQVAKSILYGQADPLFSSFHLGYNMLLNLLRVEDADPEFMIRQSFHQFQNEQAAPGLEELLAGLESELEEIKVEDEDTVADYYHLSKQMSKTNEEIQGYISKPEHALPFLNPGRLVRIEDKEDDWGWGVVVNFEKKKERSKDIGSAPEGLGAYYIVHVLLNCKAGSQGPLTPCPPNTKGEMKVVPLVLQILRQISSLRVYIPKDLRSVENRQAVLKSIKEIQRRFPDGFPTLDPIEDMQIEDASFKKLVLKAEDLQKKLVASEFHTSSQRDELIKTYDRKMETEAKVRHLKKEIKTTKSMVLRENLKSMKRVLRRLGHTDKDNVVQLKGRVACEISTADELLVTELIFNNVFNPLSVEQCVALLSCVVHLGKADESVRVRDELAAPYRQLQEAARHIAKISIESKITLDAEEYVNQFTVEMMEPVLEWCRGAKFSEICKMTEIFEGTIIRCIRRLEELLKQLALAAHAIGNVELEKKFNEGSSKIKRDIVFAASLYL